MIPTRTPHTHRFGRIAWCLAVAALLLAIHPAAAQFVDEPDNKHATLIDKDGSPIFDDEISMQFRDLLTGPLGLTNAMNATFLFQQCFSGGMIDDLIADLPSDLDWIAGAASRHDESSYGSASARELTALGFNPGPNHPTAFDHWTQALLPGLDADQTIASALSTALANDASGPSNSNLENPQIFGMNAADSIQLVQPGATSFHAVLWAGQADGDRHFNDIQAMRDKLVTHWGDPATNANITISVLFGDGMTNAAGNDLPAEWDALPADRTSLSGVFDDLDDNHLGPTEQFLFYASDHGGTLTDLVAFDDPTATIDPSTTEGFSMTLSLSSIKSFDLDLNNVPEISTFYSVETDPLLADDADALMTDTIDLFLNDVLIGSLDPAGFFASFPVDESLLLADNTLRVENNPTDTTLSLFNLRFFSGSVDTIALIPEPTALAVLTFSTLLLAQRRRVA